METITIMKEEYNLLKRKAYLADDVLLQLKASLEDIETGRIKPFDH